MRDGLVLAGIAISLSLLAAGASGASAPAGDWASFGRSTDNMRHSPLTQITRANVDQLGRVYNLDLKTLDPDVRRGEQSYPLAIGGTLYETTNDAQVFALDGATRKVIWHFKPANSGLFKNFGIVANRGLAYCDGALFLLTLDMHLNKLDPKTGGLLGRVAIGKAVHGASTNYGYSQTSAPICANHRIFAGASGSEYGVRGYVMAWTTSLRPAWPSPVWTVPPELAELALGEPDRRRRRGVDAGDRRPGLEHGLLRHGLCDAALLPAAAPRPEPAHRLVDRRRSEDGAAQVVAPADRRQPVVVRRSATMDVKLPASPTTPLAVPTSSSYTGAYYNGVLVGVSGPGGVIKPISATWPDLRGRFTLVLPGSARGKPLRVWEDASTFFQTRAAVPGGPIQVGVWPSIPPGDQPQGLAVVRG